MDYSVHDRYLKVVGLFLSLMVIAPLSQALTKEETKPILAYFHNVQIHAYQAINSYYNFSLNPGDKELHSQILTEMSSLESTLSALESSPGIVDIQGELADINEQWVKYRDLLNTNIDDAIKLGYPDLRLLADMAQSNIDVVGAVERAYERAQDVSGFKPTNIVATLRDSKLLLASMMTKYSARSASTVSQIFQGAKTEEAMDVQAEHFDKRLAELMKTELNKGDSAKVLDSISTKWNFIRNSYKNYNENNVSYVVNLYSYRIIDALDDLLKQNS
ncbi:hypothetical protein BTA51_21685 [Hahella sp. CCB-MM4]|uniref:hypothetical protein n=1 Tax=Hahella sp. (strain CCB-MM4) TaxID=1926491 RepID=UPI000B9C2FE3|nr:hypothetical protein [Hahella sp. CCB-MM4]OZG71262.1 hypothetical protein BTA51_21685 [Hahella sp. CCB-MM4]